MKKTVLVTLTAELASSQFSADGKQLVFASNRGGIDST